MCSYCAGESECEREDCTPGTNSFFPQNACWELEVKLIFPSCWDGVSVDSSNHMSHVAYDMSSEGQFDGVCPDSHPVKIPETHFYFRIFERGGAYTFSDDIGTYHADYMSGWNATELQRVLDECTNDSDAASPNAWCENHLTFRDAPKRTGDDRIQSKRPWYR